MFFKARKKAEICFANVRTLAARTGKLIYRGTLILVRCFVFTRQETINLGGPPVQDKFAWALYQAASFVDESSSESVAVFTNKW